MAMSRVRIVTDTGADIDKRVAEAWARVEAGLGRVLTASLRQLNAPAAVDAIDAVEAALSGPVPQDFRAQSPHHRDGTNPARHCRPLTPAQYRCNTSTTPTRSSS